MPNMLVFFFCQQWPNKHFLLKILSAMEVKKVFFVSHKALFPQGSESHLFEKQSSRKIGPLCHSVMGPNFLRPYSKPTSCHKDRRNLLFLWIKQLSKQRWLSLLPGEFRMNYVWQIVLSSTYVWNSYWLSRERVCNGLYLLDYTKDFFLSL